MDYREELIGHNSGVCCTLGLRRRSRVRFLSLRRIIVSCEEKTVKFALERRCKAEHDDNQVGKRRASLHIVWFRHETE